MGREKIIKERCVRPTIWDALDNYCYLANDTDFIEVTRWVNGDGCDIVIGLKNDSKIISLTYGQIKAIYKLSKELDK